MKGPYEALQAPAADSCQRASTGELDTYYDKAIAHICDADSILITGRGVAKHELQKRMGENRLGARVGRG